MEPKARFLTPQELEYVRMNCLAMTDEELAKHLGRDIRSIRRARRRLGIRKGAQGMPQPPEDKSGTHNAAYAAVKLNEKEREEFFKTQFANTISYELLKEQFSEREIQFYMEEWGSLCVQFEDIVATEKRQIDELIKTEIMANRIRRNIKVAEDEIKLLIAEIDELRREHDVTEEEEAQERDMQIMSLIRTMGAQSNSMSNDLQRNIDLRNKLLQELNARRADRVDQIKKRGTTFIGLVETMRNREVREQQGRHMELLRLATEKLSHKWHQPNAFPDGHTKDCIVLDDNSNLPEVEVVRIENIKSVYSDDFNASSGKSILLVENDIKRIQFFQEIFANHKLSYASNSEKAIQAITDYKYDLICLDYDLAAGDKSDVFVDYIVQNGKCKATKFLIHTMNKNGSKKLYNMLELYMREVSPFNDIKLCFGERNAKDH